MGMASDEPAHAKLKVLMTIARITAERDEARQQRDELLGAIERYEAAMTQPSSAGPARTRIWRKALYDTAKRIRRETGTGGITRKPMPENRPERKRSA